MVERVNLFLTALMALFEPMSPIETKYLGMLIAFTKQNSFKKGVGCIGKVLKWLGWVG